MLAGLQAGLLGGPYAGLSVMLHTLLLAGRQARLLAGCKAELLAGL
jgi:hypothetical protein